MVQYRLIRSKNRRRSMALQLNARGQIVVRAPILMPKFFIDRFVASHQGWIEKQQKVRSRPKVVRQKYFDSQLELERYVRVKVVEYSEMTGLKPANLRFRHVKTYWGSCSPKGVISFNSHLQYAPPEAVDYVIVHELCHLKYRGHGVRFWDLVKRYCLQTNEMRQILRQIARE